MTTSAGLNALVGSKISDIKRRLQNEILVNQIRPRVSAATASWLDRIITEATNRKQEAIPKFDEFTLPDSEGLNVLHVKKTAEQFFLCTVDGKVRFPVRATKNSPFDRVANDPRVAFVRSGDVWRLILRDPKLSRS